MKFVGRFKEIQTLNDFYQKEGRHLISLIGRRGVGKTRLNDEFKKKITDALIIEWRGVKNAKRQMQIDYCAETFFETLNIKERTSFSNWHSFFSYVFKTLSELNTSKKIVFIIDEFAWLHNKGSNFVEHFAVFYDKFFNINSLFIITASAVSWMNKNVLRTKGGLHGKTHRTINLKPFSLAETVLYLKTNFGQNFSNYQLLNYYFFTGGVVRYLEKINPALSIQDNAHLIFKNSSEADNEEFSSLFNTVFEGSDDVHKNVVLTFKKGNNKTKMDIYNEINKNLEKPRYSYNTIAQAVDDLVVSQILTRKQNYGKTNSESYFLTDLFCYFYIKILEGKQLNYSLLADKNIQGFAFEILVLLNIELIKETISRSGFESKSYSWRNKHSQIDLIIDYGNNIFSLIEAKYHDLPFKLNAKETDNILNKKDAFLESIRRTKKEMDVILVSFAGTKNEDGRLNYIDVNLNHILDKLKNN